MVDFDAAVAAVQDPNADPVFLAKIAYENPEFGANVVANQRAYPGLKRWVAEFGDERARQQLVAMGWPVPQNASASAGIGMSNQSKAVPPAAIDTVVSVRMGSGYSPDGDCRASGAAGT